MINNAADAALPEFLLARIAEEEADAVDAAKAVANGAQVWDRIHPDVMAHLGRITPARVLADCAARRQIVQYVGNLRATDGVLSERYRAAWWITRLLSKRYVDHPDYFREWRP